MEIKLITQLARVMTRAKLTELEIEDEKEGIKVHLKRGGADRSGSNPIVNVTHGGPVGSGGYVGSGSYGPSGGFGTGLEGPGGPSGSDAAAPVEGGRGPLAPGTFEFKSPMVGTFYRSPSPDSEAFCDVGTKFDEESVLCIVEAMKVMNEIKAETTGTIVELLVENAEPVEFGQPLFLFRKGS